MIFLVILLWWIVFWMFVRILSAPWVERETGRSAVLNSVQAMIAGIVCALAAIFLALAYL